MSGATGPLITGRRALGLLIWLPLGFGFVLLLAAAAPLLIGDRSFVVQSGSMAPAIETGDVVVVERIPASEAAVGEIVTFRDPKDKTRLLTHRAVAIERRDGKLAFTTQGDANTGRERWLIEPAGELGRVRYRVPMLGFATSWIGGPGGRIALVVVPALLLGASLLIRVWSGDRGEVHADGRAA